MSTGLIDIMKRASMGAMDASKLCDLRYGTVVSTKPLKVRVTNQFVLTEAMLVVPKHLTNYTVNVTANFELPAPTSGTTHKLTINNALRTGDKVALLRQTGGQSYFVLDKI